MLCNGICSICSNPCFRGEIKEKQETISPELEEKLSEVFDTAIPDQSSETGLVVVEDIPAYELKRNIFGKEKVRKIK